MLGSRETVVERNGGDDFHWERESRVDERPVDRVDETTIGRDPASDDLRVALVADDQIGLAQGLIANDADENDLRGVARNPADSQFDGITGLAVDIEAELVARNLGRGCRTGAANSTGLRCSATADRHHLDRRGLPRAVVRRVRLTRHRVHTGPVVVRACRRRRRHVYRLPPDLPVPQRPYPARPDRPHSKSPRSLTGNTAARAS